MTIRNLDAVFKPTSVAILGASNRPNSLGKIVLDNLAETFSGPIYAVNPKFADPLARIPNVHCYANVAALPIAPELAVIVTPWRWVPELIQELGAKGTRGCCVITAGPLQHEQSARTWHQDILNAAQPYLMRVVGPNGVGLQVPGRGLDASFAHLMPRSGSIGFVAQSGAVITAVLDWTNPRRIGFSHIVSLGDMVDVDFGDMLDYLATDPQTDAILMYIEAVTNVRKFISSARAASRIKPVIVVKAGRFSAGARAAASHTGAMAGNDAVYDAVFRRAGMLRVHTLTELFSTIETLSTARLPGGDTLTILTNGGGMGVLAADELMANEGQLTQLSNETVTRLDAVLPANWSHANPVDIIGDANGERYTQAIDILLAADETNALLVLNCPTAISSSTEVARAVIATFRDAPPFTVLTCWVGDQSMGESRQLFASADIPTYQSPEEAVKAYAQMITYRRNQAQLLETPPSVLEQFEPDTVCANSIISAAQSSRREWLSEFEAKEILQAYGIPITVTHKASSPTELAELAANMQGPVVIKILSEDITHKSDVGGVLLNVAPQQVESAAEAMRKQVQARLPQARLEGFTLQPMVAFTHTVELIAGIIDDPQFGPILLFGHGGTAVEVLDDKSLALPPLNLKLARELISRTRVYALLKGYRNVPPVDLDAITLVLVRLAQLAIDCPDIQELDINPLLAHNNGVVALDARIRINLDGRHSRHSRLAIRPYPRELERYVTWNSKNLVIRPIVPEDEEALSKAVAHTEPASGNLATMPQLVFVDHPAIARMTQIDYDRQMVTVLAAEGVPGRTRILATARIMEDPDREHGALSINTLFATNDESTAESREEAAQMLLTHIIDYAIDRGLKRLTWSASESTRGVLSSIIEPLTHTHNIRLSSQLDGSGGSIEQIFLPTG